MIHHLLLPLLRSLPALGYSGENVFAILVQLQFCDDNLRRGDTDGDRLAIALLAGETLDVYDPYKTCQCLLFTIQFDLTNILTGRPRRSCPHGPYVYLEQP